MTRALLVVHKGKLIKEQYAPGFDKDSPILGWSMTKSITNILMGILNKQGLLEVDEKNLFEAWKKDNRKNISIDDLMRMSSGLDWTEDYGNNSEVTEMLFNTTDIPAYAIDQDIEADPGEHWEYSSGTTNILSKVLRDKCHNHTDYLAYPYRELFHKLGIHNMTLESDASGHYVLSSYCFGPPQEWAKLGQLYLNKGIWNQDTLFTQDWYDYSLTPTPHSNGSYGAQMWLNIDHVFLKDAPEDMFYYSGYEGQYVMMVPSKELVIVRMGLSKGPPFDLNAVVNLICKAVEG